MKEFDFDAPIDRKDTESLKWDIYKDRDIVPLWVADMDFRSPPAVIEALNRRVAHGIFGYTHAPNKLTEIISSILKEEYNWDISGEWLVWLPGLVTGLNVSCRCVGGSGDDILTTVPIYPPFLTAPGFSKRQLVTFNMINSDNKWVIDFDQLERVVTPRTKMLLLCNPHNPTGRVFTKEELTRLANFCFQRDILICSDEIHCGLILDENKQHIPTASLSPEIEQKTITLMAPSKTYNIPGLGFSFAIISDPEIRKRFKQVMEGIVPHVNALGYRAAIAAYQDSSRWHSALLNYLRNNGKIVYKTINKINGLSMAPVEATYLAWIDINDLGLENPVIFFEKAGVGLSDGVEFGMPGYLRLNFGCPKQLLVDCIKKIETAILASS